MNTCKRAPVHKLPRSKATNDLLTLQKMFESNQMLNQSDLGGFACNKAIKAGMKSLNKEIRKKPKK